MPGLFRTPRRTRCRCGGLITPSVCPDPLVASEGMTFSRVARASLVISSPRRARHSRFGHCPGLASLRGIHTHSQAEHFHAGTVTLSRIAMSALYTDCAQRTPNYVRNVLKMCAMYSAKRVHCTQTPPISAPPYRHAGFANSFAFSAAFSSLRRAAFARRAKFASAQSFLPCASITLCACLAPFVLIILRTFAGFDIRRRNEA
jgi:hypothetical protein